MEDNLRNSTDYNVVRPDNCCCCPPNFDVLLTDLDIFYHWLTNDLFYSHIDYLILDNCDIVLTNSQLGYIVNFIGSKFANSRILGITSEIVIGDKKSMEIEHYFLLLSEKLNCKLNTLSDLVWSIKYDFFEILIFNNYEIVMIQLLRFLSIFKHFLTNLF